MGLRRNLLLLSLSLLISAPIATYAQNQHGRFVGTLKLQLLDNGRDAKLEDEFTFVDQNGVIWNVPHGAVVDGASIPEPLWSIMGSPFIGKYRNASVIHDYYCETKYRPWKAVHKVFYDAMLMSGVSTLKAKLMYGAVYAFGPRWGGGATPQKYSSEKFNELKSFIEGENPTLKQIEEKTEQVGTNITTSGDCSGVYTGITGGNVTINSNCK